MEVLQNINTHNKIQSFDFYGNNYFNKSNDLSSNNMSNNDSFNKNSNVNINEDKVINNNLSRNTLRIALISVHGDPAIDFGKEEAGGQNVYVRNIGEELARLGWYVDMFTRKVSPNQETIVQLSERCRTIRLKAGPISFVGRDNLFVYAPDFLQSFLEFQKSNNVVYSIVHTNYWISGWIGLQLRKLQGSKQLHTYHSLGCIKYNSIENIPPCAETRLKYEKEILENAECIIATSPEEECDMRKHVSVQGNIVMVPCGTDIEKFTSINRVEARKLLNFDQQDKIVLYVGRFDYRKGIETLVRAINLSKFKNDPKLKLIIGGGSTPGHSDGNERERIESIVNELSLENKTLFTGQLGPSNLHLYYAAADCCVVPSHYEPFGLVPIEAMASSTPVVGSCVGGLKYTIVNELTGFLCQPKNNEEFAKAIDNILSSVELRDKLAKNGLKRVHDLFKWKSVCIKIDNLYMKFIKDSQQAC